MISRRKKPDGLPFRLYQRIGKFKVSYAYKLPTGKFAFWLSAPIAKIELVEKIRQEAIHRAEVLNGNARSAGSTENLIREYFAWQDRMPVGSEDRKAAITLDENKIEARNLIKVFGAMEPEHIRPKDIYKFLSMRLEMGAPAKANKEIALLSAVLEYGRRLGLLEINPCRGIKYNKTRPRQKYVGADEIKMMMDVAQERGGSYRIVALCLYTAYMTVSRPQEMRSLTRQSIHDDGLEIDVGKRKPGQPQRTKLIYWSTELRATIDEALSLQRTPGIYIFSNTTGQVYTRSGFTTILKRLMEYCERNAQAVGVQFNRFSLADMRPTAVTDRMEGGDQFITDATGHADERMVKKVYDRRMVKKAQPTNFFGTKQTTPGESDDANRRKIPKKRRK